MSNNCYIREKCASEFFINWNNFPERTRDIYCIEKLSRDPCNVPKYVSIITGEQLQLINPRINRFVIHLWDECFCSKRYYCSHATCLRNPQSDLRIHPTLPFDNIDPSKPSRDETWYGLSLLITATSLPYYSRHDRNSPKCLPVRFNSQCTNLDVSGSLCSKQYATTVNLLKMESRF